MNKKSEEFFIKYLKTLPDSHIKQFYNDVEWTPYPVLVIKEFQRRFKPKDAEFLDKLLESVNDTKKRGQKIGKIAKINKMKLVMDVEKIDKRLSTQLITLYRTWHQLLHDKEKISLKDFLSVKAPVLSINNASLIP